VPLQKAGAVTVGALKSRRSKNRRRIGDCRDSRLEVVNSVGVEFVAYRRTRRDCEGQAYDEQSTTRVHTTMLVERVASRQIWITKLERHTSHISFIFMFSKIDGHSQPRSNRMLPRRVIPASPALLESPTKHDLATMLGYSLVKMWV
jgi:hypothetical protein